MKRNFLTLFFILSVGILTAQSYRPVVDSLITDAVRESKIPGAVLCVVNGDRVEYMQAYGYRQVYPDTLPMTVSTQFDMASLSKVVGTGMSLMTLVDKGVVNIEDNIQKYLPEYQPYADSLGAEGRPQKVVDFLTHTSGLPAYASYKSLLHDHPNATAAERKSILLDYMATCRRLAPAGTEFRYSCLNFITLQYLIERVTGMTLDNYAKANVFRPLGMKHTCYYPLGGKSRRCQVIAPTEKIAPCDTSADVPSIIWSDNLYGKNESVIVGYTVGKNNGESVLKGYSQTKKETKVRMRGCRNNVTLRNKDCFEAIVHDPLAREMNAGVSGNAGVFSTADDLAKLAVWMLNADTKQDAGAKLAADAKSNTAANHNTSTTNGQYLYKGPISPETLHLMMTVPAGYEAFGRALAWDQSSDYAGCKGSETSPSVVCHTGYTGTCMVVDPEKKIALILLTNRVHPEDAGGVAALRKAVANAVFAE